MEELRALFTFLGVKRGDTVMLHSAVFTLGVIENGLQGLYQAVRDLMGDDGTLIVPTFTFSFRRHQVFDVLNSPPSKEIGSFSDYIRRHPDSTRSLDPLFSMSAIGPKQQDLMERKSRNSFGEGSIYEKIFTANTLILALGITYSTGISAFMHIEKLARIDYRYDLTLEGRTVGYDGVERDDVVTHFARDESKYPTGHTNRDPFGQEMEAAGISIAADFGSGHHVALRSQPFLDFTLSALKQDPHLMYVNQ